MLDTILTFFDLQQRINFLTHLYIRQLAWHLDNLFNW